MRALALVLLLLASCGGSGTPEGGSATFPGRFELPEYSLAGYRELISNLEGSPVVVNVWGSWCPPCRKEAPRLASLSGEYGDRVRFLGIDILDDRESARDFMREFEIPYPSVFDPEAEIRDGLGYLGQPVTIVHDARGNVTFEKTGEVAESELRREIEKVL